LNPRLQNSKDYFVQGISCKFSNTDTVVLHASLDVDVNLMSAKERKEATKMLLEAVERLAGKGVKARTSRQKVAAE